jgi:hypothetical protein
VVANSTVAVRGIPGDTADVAAPRLAGSERRRVCLLDAKQMSEYTNNSEVGAYEVLLS